MAFFRSFGCVQAEFGAGQVGIEEQTVAGGDGRTGLEHRLETVWQFEFGANDRSNDRFPKDEGAISVSQYIFS